jgi:hypothetical protein
MLEPNTNLPEWVQSKITLAKDYIETACDYLQTQMKEETVQEGRSLTFQQRLVRARQMKRIEPKVYRGQLRYQERVPSQSRLEKRAERMARNLIKQKISHTPYDQMTIPEKIMIDKILERKQKAIKRLAQRLLPKVRQISIERLSGVATTIPKMPMQRLVMGEETIPYLSESVNTIYALASGEETKAVKALKEKAEKAGVSFEEIVEVYSEAVQKYTPRKISSEQYAFNAVNCFVSNKLNEDFRRMSVNQMFSEMFVHPDADRAIETIGGTLVGAAKRKALTPTVLAMLQAMSNSNKQTDLMGNFSRRAGKRIGENTEITETAAERLKKFGERIKTQPTLTKQSGVLDSTEVEIDAAGKRTRERLTKLRGKP